MLKAFLLIALGVTCRLVDHQWNFVPMGALALYAGAVLPRRWAWIVPLAAMGISDLRLDTTVYARPFLDPSRWIIYATFASLTLLGPLARRPKYGWMLIPGLSLAVSAIFFLTSNFGSWLVPELNYERSFSGLMTCYAAGIPFFDKTVVADLVGCGVLFGLGAALEQAARLIPARRPALQPVHETTNG